MRGIRGHFLPRYGSPRLPPARWLESWFRLASSGSPRVLRCPSFRYLAGHRQRLYAVLKGRYLPLRPARTVLASVVGPIAGGIFT